MLQAQDGQNMRLTLVNFNMYNNLFNVNATNNQFRVVSRFGAANAETQFLGLSTLHEIASGNYKSCGDKLLRGIEDYIAQHGCDIRLAEKPLHGLQDAPIPELAPIYNMN